jgi:hypothetical protein
MYPRFWYCRPANFDRLSLARSNHTLTVLHNKAYIFGGETAHGELASNDMHIVTLVASEKPDKDYQLLPALASDESNGVPVARSKHAACVLDGSIAVYGGCDEKGNVIEEGSCIWLFDTEKLSWSQVKPANTDSLPKGRHNAKLFAHETSLILCGGEGNLGATASDIWQYDTIPETWTQLPPAPAPTTNAVLTNGQIYLVSGSDPMSSQLHHFSLSEKDEVKPWETFTFPTNPIAPGPRAREGGGFLPITTGYGRNYLVYFLGAVSKPSDSTIVSEDETHNITQYSDMWTLQLPSSDLELKPSWSVKDAIKPAKIKDAIRSVLGAETGKHTWGEVEVVLPTDLLVPDGKLHPGPRGFFGCDVMDDGRTVVLWGGENAKGERVGDGWIIKLE